MWLYEADKRGQSFQSPKTSIVSSFVLFDSELVSHAVTIQSKWSMLKNHYNFLEILKVRIFSMDIESDFF